MGLIQAIRDIVQLNWHRNHFTADNIRDYQQREVLKLLSFVRQSSPFYADLYNGIDVHDLESYANLPVINKQTMMDHFDRLNTAGLELSDVLDYAVDKELNQDFLGYYRDRYVVGLSSGTSGSQGIYVTDKALTKRLPGVFLARGGVFLRDLPLRILFILRVFSQGFADIRAPLIQLTYRSSMTEPAELIEALNNQGTNILMAPPSLLKRLLPLADKIKRPPKRIISYAEVLEAESKAVLSHAFKAPIVEIYQASEGQIASPCRCGNLHINEDLVFVELFEKDGQTPVTRPGQRAGRMLVTNLVNRVQPLLRYEMNDLIELGDPCPCGSHFRVIRRIIGRQDDVLELPGQNGQMRALYPDLVSRWIITADDRIREYRVEQDESNHLLVTLDVLDPNKGSEIIRKVEQRMLGELAQYGFNCRITIQIESIRLPEDRSKYKRFIHLK